MALPSRAYPGLALGPTTSYKAGDGTHVENGQIIASRIGTPTLISASSTSTSTSTPNSTSGASSLPSKSKQQQQPAAPLPTISISRSSRGPTAATTAAAAAADGPRLPRLNSTVLGAVTRVTKDRVTLRLLAVDGAVLVSGSGTFLSDPLGLSSSSSSPPMTGVIRREDVRGWEIDKVVTAEMFRVGDVVRATVISIGDQAAYYLSTARNELGVLMARAADEGDGGGGGGAGGGAGGGGRGGGWGAELGDWMVPVSWREFADPVSGRREVRKVARPV